MLGIFLEDSPGHLQAIREAVAGADPAALMRAAHTMSGSLRVLGAAAATALVARLEALGREGRLEGAAALSPGSSPSWSGCGAPPSRRSRAGGASDIICYHVATNTPRTRQIQEDIEVGLGTLSTLARDSS